MTSLSFDVIHALYGRTVATAESCTGGLIGGALTSVEGSSAVYKGGVISYTNSVKEAVLGVNPQILSAYGAVSSQTAQAMAFGVRELLHSDFAVSTTGLAGPGGDDFGNPVGTVYIGIAGDFGVFSKHYIFDGEREQVRKQAVEAALKLLLDKIKEYSH